VFILQGVLKDGSIVAIKKINKRWPRNYDKLLPVVSKLHYKNIVKFVGYGHEVLSTSGVQLFKRKKDQAKDSEFIWVEEYVPSGSLHEFINVKFTLWNIETYFSTPRLTFFLIVSAAYNDEVL
jgi:hypothetical protein